MRDLFREFVLTPILESVTNFASRNAFYISGKHFTYQQLGEAIDSKRELYRRRDEMICALEVKDDLETYASILALWLEGKAYVPINPRHPKSRNQEIITQITQFDGVYENPLAYVLFTSGSTGTPKGVAISRDNVGAFMESFWKTGIVVDENDRCLQCFDLTFDVSVQSFLVALTKGACVYTVPYGQVKYLHVASLIHEQHITFGAMAPSMLTYLRPYFSELDASSLKVCILTAEACPVDLIGEWQKCAVNAEVYDFYGPTEATVYCTAYHCVRSPKQNLSVNGVISIGKPLANVQAVILDENGGIVASPFEKGELCVAGGQVTPGYWNNPKKNASAFSMINLAGRVVRIYHTGDLCYWDESGNLMYIGRIDQQVKIQGFRVELSEIEYHARAYFNNAVRAAAVAFMNEQSLNEIALFVEREADPQNDLMAYMRGKLPAYMIPSKILFVQEFPLNSNDKIDRNKLKAQL